jgi:hypothetical protein
MKKKRPKKRRATDEELLPYMDYLHGEVIDGEFKAACHYEYARESSILRKASQLLRNNPTADAGEVFFHVERELPSLDNWLISHEWSFIWQCPSFPAKGWNQLSEAERTELLYGLPISTNEPRPLRLGEVMFLTHFLDQLRGMAEKARAELKEELKEKAARARKEEEAPASNRPRRKVYPILELKGTPFVQVLLPLDFSKSKQRLLQEIDLWLELTKNKARFVRHTPRTEAGTEKQAKDRLKDLAAWKLFRGRGRDGALEFAEQHRKHDKNGQPRAFHDPRQGRKERGELQKVLPNEAPLYSWQTGESAFRKVKVRIDRYLAELIPWEFGKYAVEGRTIWIVDAHRDGKRFVVRADEKLTAFLELQSAIHEFAVGLIA